MNQSPGFVDPTKPDHLCLLKKSLYGLKQAPRAWYQRFAQYATKVGFVNSKSVASLFVLHRGKEFAYLLLYVDDIILTASSNTLLRSIISSLKSEFDMSDLGNLHYFLGIVMQRLTNEMFLSQQNYAADILHRANMTNCNPCATPFDTCAKFRADVGAPVEDPMLYRSLAGAFQYLTFTRSDIAYAVQQICLYMHDPREPHFNAHKRILRYLKAMITQGLHLSRPSTTTITHTQMPIGLTVRIHVAPHQGIVSSLVTTSYLGPPKGKKLSHALVPKQNIEVLRMQSHKQHGYVTFYLSFIVPLPKPHSFTVTM
uniref:Putative mitochondrial protein n=1 Tax=Noccaea caerulescens TaxID=107243 RepID=A0A1J3F6I4_NOCCA